MTIGYNGAVVVIPTRNRVELAMNAIRSVLAQPGCDIHVLVSDNSTTEEDTATLLRFCELLKDERLRYVRPPEHMPMPTHWEWAIQQALNFYQVNHFIYLTDRRLFKASALSQVLHLAKLHPDTILTYNEDMVDDLMIPCRLEQALWTGKLLSIKSTQLLYLSSRMMFHTCLPRMLNCVVPRYILETIRRRFGNIFLSIVPDFCFAYRSLAMVDSILYFDKSPILHRALDRSLGMSQIRGVVSRDHADFLANLGHLPLNFAAPVPELRTVHNVVVHEYCVARQEAGSWKFPEVDKARYLQAMARDVHRLENPELKRDMFKVLEAAGWNSEAGSRTTGRWRMLGQWMTPLMKMVRLRGVFERVVSAQGPDIPLWGPVDAFLQLAMYGFLGWFPAQTYLRCDSVESAIDHANNSPQRRFRSTRHLEMFIEGGGSFAEEYL